MGVILFIVEGKSEEAALGPVFEKLFEGEKTVLFAPEKSDYLTTETRDPQELIRRLENLIEKTLRKDHLKITDLDRIVQFADTDGCFIPDENVKYFSDQEKVLYQAKRIVTKDKPGIEMRNRKKSENTMRMAFRGELLGVPYALYFFSCNLDHVLYNERNLADKQKVRRAMRFSKQYWRRPERLISFLAEQSGPFSDYEESWDWIREGNHSLKRSTNAALVFDEEEEEDLDSLFRTDARLPEKLHLVFDLDDTFYDRSDLVKEAFDATFGRERRPLDWAAFNREFFRISDEIYLKIGRGEATSEEQQERRISGALESFGLEASEEEIKRFQIHYEAAQRHLRPHPAMEKLLDVLKDKKGVDLFLLSNGGSAHQREKIRTMGLDRFFDPDKIYISGDYPYQKPDRAMFEKVTGDHGLDPKRTVMIGDNLFTDIEGAADAGWRTVWLDRAGSDRKDKGTTVQDENELFKEVMRLVDESC